MPDTLTARLLTEIERRHAASYRKTGSNQAPPSREEIRYLAALRVIAELHEPDSADPRVCFLCSYSDGAWPCDTIRAIAEALEVTP